ncbi:hypothetical protein [Candidatus Pollutiaquabacter sp.]|uniref:hypothetical protein n=1 Tax=Candidatus Pollutiaquabacter sp. TaxID=3416354 RepID=UPI003C9D9593|nr:hypothetical protein [Bacteroidota bacterium]
MRDDVYKDSARDSREQVAGSSGSVQEDTPDTRFVARYAIAEKKALATMPSGPGQSTRWSCHS